MTKYQITTLYKCGERSISYTTAKDVALRIKKMRQRAASVERVTIVAIDEVVVAEPAEV